MTARPPITPRSRLGPASAAELFQDIVASLVSTGGSASAVSTRVTHRVTEALRQTQAAKTMERHWNGEFQALLELEDGVEKVSLSLSLYLC